MRIAVLTPGYPAPEAAHEYAFVHARARLYAATVQTVRGAIDARRGIPIHELKAAKVASMRVHGRAGEHCPVCGDTIRDFAFAGTTAQYCPTCQTGGAQL